MFERVHHIRIANILQALDAELLVKHGCLFGGGTAIVLAHGEYRESVDVDFFISNLAGYQALRRLLTEGGIQSIMRANMNFDLAGDIRADQYGIRTMLRLGEAEIKFEIVLEGRIQLEESKNRICGVSTLTSRDMATSKLLANSDRWADDAVCSRDLIDLAMLNLARPAMALAIEKASDAYGESIKSDLAKAIKSLGRKGRLEKCMDALKIDNVPKALLWERVRKWRAIK